MTITGAGGVSITGLEALDRFRKEYKKLPPEIQKRVDSQLKKLVITPMPSGIAFEKLKRYSNPDIYTIHITGNYKVSMEIDGQTAFLRRVANHDEIDRAP